MSSDSAPRRYAALEERLGHRFADQTLCETALTHPSSVNEPRDAGRAHNERLEFLGDAVVGLCASALLLRSYPGRSEGELSRLRASLVSTQGLSRAAENLDLGPWVFLGRGEEQAGGRQRPSLLADALEALMGAVFLDGGFAAATRVIEAWLAPLLPKAEALAEGDAKTRLQQLTQAAYHEGPRYEVLGESGPGHAKVFEVAVYVQGGERGRASGRSKKEAEQGAAAAALAAWTPPAEEGARRAAPIDAAAIPTDVREVCERLQKAGHEAHLVGGGIRDLVLGRAPKDFDVATSARPEQVMRLFGATFAIPTGLQHGTVTVLTPGGEGARRPVEVTTFRGEGAYLDGRRPSSVTFVSSLEQDLARRDFTMNALAWDPVAARLCDPFGGQTDIAAALVRAVGDPVARFGEDGLRPLRAVRQATQLGFEIDPPTFAAIGATLDVFRKVSMERVRDEMLKLLAAPKPSRGIEMLRRSGLLADVLPELLESVGVTQNRFHRFDVYEHTLATVDATPGDAITRLGALLHDVGKPRARQPREGAPGEFMFFKHEYVGAEMADAIARRWKLSVADRERVCALVTHHMFFYTPDWSDGTVRRFVRRVGADLLPALFALREGDVAARGFGEDPDKEIGELRRRIGDVAAADAALRITDLVIDGGDVMRALGVAPGRMVGRVLGALLERVLDDPALNDRERLLALVPEVARALDAAPPST